MPTMWLSENQSTAKTPGDESQRRSNKYVRMHDQMLTAAVNRDRCRLLLCRYVSSLLMVIIVVFVWTVIDWDIGGLFLFGGVLMFFDRSLLAMGNILFLIGLSLIIGLQKTIAFFTRRQKLQGTAAFLCGIFLILFRWTLTGFLIELYGLFILFGDFLITIGQFAGNIPVVGPYVQRALEVLAGGRRNSELPV